MFLTKPLGVGIITTAEKKGIAEDVHLQAAQNSMMSLNSIGSFLGQQGYVNALTDVTGFGLLGHLKEICEASNLSASINYDLVPKFDFLKKYIAQQAIPGGTNRNWQSYGHTISELGAEQRAVLADPQTSGGLLISVDQNAVDQFIKDAALQGLVLSELGAMTKKREKSIYIQ